MDIDKNIYIPFDILNVILSYCDDIKQIHYLLGFIPKNQQKFICIRDTHVDSLAFRLSWSKRIIFENVMITFINSNDINFLKGAKIFNARLRIFTCYHGMDIKIPPTNNPQKGITELELIKKSGLEFNKINFVDVFGPGFRRIPLSVNKLILRYGFAKLSLKRDGGIIKSCRKGKFRYFGAKLKPDYIYRQTTNSRKVLFNSLDMKKTTYPDNFVKHYSESGKIAYIGGYKNGNRNGLGILESSSNGRIYIGKWKNGKKNGVFIEKNIHEMVYVKEYNNGICVNSIPYGKNI